MDPLDATAVRVLGSLMEKAVTTADNYPLSLNALTVACNQTSNRDPVLKLDEAEVIASLDDLARRNLVRAVKRSDSRVTRYRHLMAESMHLHEAESAVLCVLLLRGAQTVGEIRTRTARLFEFPDLARVEITLESLMAFSPPLVAQLPRQPGQKEVRYAHLLSGEPNVSTVDEHIHSPVPSLDSDDVLRRHGAPDPRNHRDRPGDDERIVALEQSIDALRSELAELRSEFDEFRRQFQ